jgi:hypothetical protein
MRAVLLAWWWCRSNRLPFRVNYECAKAQLVVRSWRRTPWWRRHYNVDRLLRWLIILMVWAAMTAILIFVVCVTFAGVMWLYKGG